ncbi:MAG: hypothetical protein JXR83_20685 [Deltaproteobacteria bacterium]|nr:hypothetical protein [Deltaproteobacteria bacterium]
MVPLIALAGALASACFFDTTVAPASDGGLPQINCNDSRQCPPGWICNAALHRCVPADAVDREAPGLAGTPVLTPQVGGVGQDFTLQFSVSEHLASDPVVKLDLGSDRQALFAIDLEQSDAAGRHYFYSYTATGSELEGARVITVDLVDRSGNQASGLNAGLLLLDFTPPHVATSALEPARARAGVELTLYLEMSEEVDGLPAISMQGPSGGSLPWSDHQASGALAHLFKYIVRGDEVEGIQIVRAQGRDLAGNAFDDDQLAKVVLDFTPPALAAGRDATIVPVLATRGQRVVVEVEVSEELASVGDLTAIAESGTLSHNYAALGGTSLVLRYEHVVQDGEDGRYALLLNGLVDLAGNTTESIALGAVVYDTTPPSLVDFYQSHQALLVDDTLEVRFGTDEPLGREPVVKLGALSMVRDGTADDPYRYLLSMAGTQVVGAQILTVWLADVAGNEQILAPAIIDVDAVPPSLIDVVFTPPAARLGTTAVLTITASEPLGAIPVVDWMQPLGDPGFEYLDSTGLGHVWAIEVAEGMSTGIYRVTSVTLTDSAGNVAEVEDSSGLALFDIDSVPPQISPLEVNGERFSAIAPHDLIAVEFDVSETPAGGVHGITATIAHAPLDCQELASSPPRYRCTYQVSNADAEGALPVLVVVGDAAGNSGIANTVVVVDRTPPQVIPETVSVRIYAPPTSLISEVTALGPGAAFQLAFSLDEAVAPGSEPRVATRSPEVLDLARERGTTSSFIYRYTLDAQPHAQGTYAVEVEAVDDVGNAGLSILDLPAPGFVVDTLAPAAPPVDVAGAVSYLRVPWGSDATGPGPHMSVAVAADAVEAGSVLVVHSAAAAPRAELGRAPVQAGVATAIELLPADRARVYVTAVDQAGSASPSVRVRDVEWVATLGGKIVGRTQENPHRHSAHPWFVAALQQPKGAASGNFEVGAAEMSAVDGTTVRVTGAGRWENRHELQIPAVGWANSVVEDPAAGITYLVDYCIHGSGPHGCDQRYGSIAVWDGWRLHEVVTTDEEGDGDPSSRNGLSYYDPVQSALITVETPTVEWVYSPERRSWGKRAIAPAPEGAPDDIYAFAVDTWTGDLYAVRVDGALVATLWKLSRQTWQQVDVSAAAPGVPDYPMRQGAVNPATGEIYFLRDCGEVGGDCAIHIWNGAQWTMPAIVDAEADGEPTEVRLIYWQDDAGEVRALSREETDLVVWRWTGHSFERLLTLSLVAYYANAIPLRMGAGDLSGLTLLARSNSCPPEYSEPARVYDYDASAGLVVRLTADVLNNVPTMMPSMQVAYHGAMQTAIAYHAPNMWAWTGLDWSAVTQAGSPPSTYRYDGYMFVQRDAAQRTVVFGGSISDTRTYEWDGTTWHAFTASGPTPPSMLRAAGNAWDSDRDRLVVFGGRDASGVATDQTWEWDGAFWSLRIPDDTEGDGNPSPRDQVAMEYDPVRGRTVMFGGQTDDTHYDDTWEWDGVAWHLMVPSDPEGDGNPPPLCGGSAVYDPVMRRVVLWGGALPPWQCWTGSAYGTERWVWLWDGASWRKESAADPEGDGDPRALTGFGGPRYLAYHPGRQAIFYNMVPNEGGDSINQVWEWHHGIDARPGQVTRFDTGAADIEQGSLIESIAFSLVAGGDGVAGTAPSPGARAQIWLPRSGRWVPLGFNGATAATPGALHVELGPADAPAIYVNDEGLSLATLPVGDNGPQRATVSVDYVEARLRYRLP